MKRRIGASGRVYTRDTRSEVPIKICRAVWPKRFSAACFVDLYKSQEACVSVQPDNSFRV